MELPHQDRKTEFWRGITSTVFIQCLSRHTELQGQKERKKLPPYHCACKVNK